MSLLVYIYIYYYAQLVLKVHQPLLIFGPSIPRWDLMIDRRVARIKSCPMDIVRSNWDLITTVKVEEKGFSNIRLRVGLSRGSSRFFFFFDFKITPRYHQIPPRYILFKKILPASYGNLLNFYQNALELNQFKNCIPWDQKLTSIYCVRVNDAGRPPSA